VLAQGSDWCELCIHGGVYLTRRVAELLVRCGAQLSTGCAGVLAAGHPRWNNPAVGRELQEMLPDAPGAVAVAALAAQWSAGISQLASAAQRALAAGECRADIPRQLCDAADGLAVIARLMHPPEVVLCGPPNAGKSTLVNALAQRKVSIVHDRAGTTRDWVSATTVFDGVAVRLTDTAGLGAQAGEQDYIETQAARRTIECAARAELVLWLSPSGEAPTPGMKARRTIAVRSKSDLGGHRPGELAVSAVSGDGLLELRTEILRELGLLAIDVAAPRAFTERQARLLREAAESWPAGADAPLRLLLG
jgi:small GTP-binding protein